jgi:hypothetical protein
LSILSFGGLPIDILINQFQGMDIRKAHDYITIKDHRKNPILKKYAVTLRTTLVGDDKHILPTSHGDNLDARHNWLERQMFPPKTWLNYKTYVESFATFCGFFRYQSFPLQGWVIARFATF